MKRQSLNPVSSFVILSGSLVGVAELVGVGQVGVVEGDAPVMNAVETSVVVTVMSAVMIVVATVMIVVATVMIAVVTVMIVATVMIAVVTVMIVVVTAMIVVVTVMIAVVTAMIVVVTAMIVVVTVMIVVVTVMIAVVESVDPPGLVIVQTSTLKMRKTFLLLELSVPSISELQQ